MEIGGEWSFREAIFDPSRIQTLTELFTKYTRHDTEAVFAAAGLAMRASYSDPAERCGTGRVVLIPTNWRSARWDTGAKTFSCTGVARLMAAGPPSAQRLLGGAARPRQRNLEDTHAPFRQAAERYVTRATAGANSPSANPRFCVSRLR